jgi:hypothetical protein
MKLITQLYAKLLCDPDADNGPPLAFSCCSDDGRIERKNDFHDLWLIVKPTNSINGNPFHKGHRLSNVPFASSVSGVEKMQRCRRMALFVLN